MNTLSQIGLGLGCVSALAAAACGSHRANLIHEQTVALEAGRFAGPVEVALPRQVDHQNRWFEIHTELRAACTPRLLVVYPDGEQATLGDDDDSWQALLARRADLPADNDAQADDAANDNNDPAARGERGRWQRVTTESWPGQLEFRRQRERRCGSARTYRRRYVTGVDETGRLTIRADVPQELAGGALTVRVYELIDEAAEARARRVAVRAERPAKPIPPKPAPQRESPKPAEAEGATWVAGHWVYRPGRGKWVWVRGWWSAPGTRPALKTERHGAPPIAGCTWQRGHWVWVPGRGAWKWVPGRWNAPPPRAETRGAPPVPESPWIAGRWIRTKTSFRWIAGRWGRPAPRAETRPPAPHDGARWREGRWLKLDGRWVWSPGFYESSAGRPPARKAETPGAPPVAGAVWLAGFWRFVDTRWQWTPGHWEHPPGEGYVWVPDPVDPVAGVSLSGRWKLIIEVKR